MTNRVLDTSDHTPSSSLPLPFRLRDRAAACEALDCTSRTLDRLMANKLLNPTYIGKLVKFTDDELLACVARLQAMGPEIHARKVEAGRKRVAKMAQNREAKAAADRVADNELAPCAP
jgi:hypothetical protein